MRLVADVIVEVGAVAAQADQDVGCGLEHGLAQGSASQVGSGLRRKISRRGQLVHVCTRFSLSGVAKSAAVVLASVLSPWFATHVLADRTLGGRASGRRRGSRREAPWGRGTPSDQCD